MTPWLGLRPPTEPAANRLRVPEGSVLGLQSPAVDEAMLGEMFAPQRAEPAPQMATPYYNPTEKKFFVNGRVVDEDDAAGMLEIEQFAGQPASAAPPPGDWRPIGWDAYSRVTQPIKNPSLGTLFTKGFGRGVDSLQLLGGYALQAVGAEETGRNIVRQQVEDLRRTEPFSRQLTEVDSTRGAIEWLVSVLGEAGPSVLESGVAALAGGLAGAAAGGGPNPLSAAGGALAALFGKGAVKQSILAAAKKYAAGETLDAAETKLLREAAGITAAGQINDAVMYGTTRGVTITGAQMARRDLRRADVLLRRGRAQSMAGGAAIGGFLGNYPLAVGDLYGSSIEGGDPNRAAAFALGIPYAALELLPEFVLAARFIGGPVSRVLANRPYAGRVGREALKRGVTGVVGGAIAEGGTEAGQELLSMAVNPEIDFDSPEGIDRIINAFGAGAAVGGFLGLSNLAARAPANLLAPGQTTEPPAATAEISPTGGPVAPTTGGALVPAQSRDLMAGGGALVPTREPNVVYRPQTAIGQEQQLALAAPPPGTVLQIEGQPDFVVDEFGNIRAATADDVVVGVTGGFVPPTAPGSQGVLNIFPEGRTTTGELRGMMEQPTQPVALLQPEGVSGEVPTAQPDLRQDVLPLDTGLAPFRLEQPTPPAPTGALAGNEQLAALQDALARRQAQEQQFAAVPPQVTPEVSAREQRLAESEPFLDVMGTEGRLVPEPQVGATMEEASQAWLDTKVGRGVRNWNQLSENVRNQWIDALNGNYTADDLKQIKRDLSAAESAARLTRTTPRTVVTGAITPAPVAPKPAPKPKRKVRAPKKPEAAKVPPAKQPGARGEALRRGGRERPAGAGRAAAQTQAAPTPVQNAQEPTVQDVRRDPQYKPTVEAVAQAARDGIITAKERREIVADLLADGDFELVADTLKKRRDAAAKREAAAKKKSEQLKKGRKAKPALTYAAVRKEINESFDADVISQEQRDLLIEAVENEQSTPDRIRAQLKFLERGGTIKKLAAGEARGVREQQRETERVQAEPETVETVTATDEDYAEISKDISAARNNGGITPDQAAKLQAKVRKQSVAATRKELLDLTNANKEKSRVGKLSDPVEVQQAVIHDQLTAAEKAALAKHYGEPTYNNTAKRRFAADFTTAVSEGLNKVAKVVRDIVVRIQQGVLALALVFNPISLQLPSNISVPSQGAQAQTPTKVTPPASAKLSPVAREVYNQLAPVAAARGSGFMIVDKQNSKLHMFRADGTHIASDTVLTGATREDVLTEERKAAQSVEAIQQKATPAGLFTTRLFRQTNMKGQPLGLMLNDKSGQSNFVAIHVSSAKQARTSALKSATVEDNAITTGCVTTSPDFYQTKMLPDIDQFVDNLVFVIPYDTAQLNDMLADVPTKDLPRSPSTPVQTLSETEIGVGGTTSGMARLMRGPRSTSARGRRRGPVPSAPAADADLPNQRRVDEMIDGMPASLRDPVRTVTDFFSGSGVRTVARFALRDQVLRLAESLGIKTVRRFSAATAARRTTLTRFEQPYLKWAEDYKRLPRNEQGMDPGSVNNIIQRMTSEDKWAFTPDYFEGADRDVTVTVDPELRAIYDRLSPEGKRSVQEAFRLNYNQLREMQDATITSVASEYDALIEAAETDAAKRKLRDEKAATLNRYKSMLNWDRAKPYAPLRVNGDWVVVGRSQRMADAIAAGDSRLVYQLEENPDDYFVTFVSTRGEAIALQNKIKGEFAYTQKFPKGQAEQELYGGGDVMFAFQKLESLLDDATTVEGADAALDPEARERAKIRREMQQGLRNSIANLKLQIMANNSIRKAELRRRGINQGHVDMVATTLSHGRSSAQFIASVKHNDKILDALRAMRREVKTTLDDTREAKQTVYNAILGHYVAGLQPQPQNTLVDKLTSFSSSWMLLLSPSYYLQQAMQNMMLTMPSLAARYGYRDTTAAFKAAYEQVTKAWVDTGITGQLNLDLIDEQYRPLAIFISESGVLDVGLDREMGSLTAESGGTYSKPFEKATGALRNLTRKIEAINRLSAAIAAYELSRSGNRGAPVTVDAQAFRDYEKDFEQNHPGLSAMTERQYAAALEALDVINTTHGDYSFENASDIFRNPLGRVALQFQKFRMIVAGLYVRAFYNAFMDPSLSAAERRVARRVLMYTTGHAAIMGGLLGSPAAAIFALIYNILSGDDEERGDLERDIRQAVGDDTIANLLLRGVPSLAGVDMSGTLGLGNLLSVAPYADLPTDRDTYAQYILSLTGPAIGGIGANVFDAVSLASDGNYYKGLEKLMPRGIGNASRGFREQITGETATRGDVLTQPIDLNAVEAVWSAIGLRPIARANRQYARDQFYKDEQFYQDRAADIKRAYVQAADDSNATAINALRLEWRALQQARRDRGFKTQPMLDLVKAPREKALRERRTVGGVPFTPATEGRARQITETAGTAG